jgi:hypothetical protein
MKTLVIALAAVLLSTAASAECLTYRQARRVYPPSTHLYWHGSPRCWNAIPVTEPHPTRIIQAEKTPAATPNPVAATTKSEASSPSIIYPSLMVNGDANKQFLQPTMAHTWQSLFDIDAMQRFSPWNTRISGQFMSKP